MLIIRLVLKRISADRHLCLHHCLSNSYCVVWENLAFVSFKPGKLCERSCIWVMALQRHVIDLLRKAVDGHCWLHHAEHTSTRCWHRENFSIAQCTGIYSQMQPRLDVIPGTTAGLVLQASMHSWSLVWKPGDP